MLSLTVRLLIDLAVYDGLMGRLDVYAFCPSKEVVTCRERMSERAAQKSSLVLLLRVFVVLATLSLSIKCLIGL